MALLQLLDFSNKGGKIPWPPYAYIALKQWCTYKHKTAKGEVDFDLLTLQCVTYQEFEYSANDLISQIEKIKKQARKFFMKNGVRV